MFICAVQVSRFGTIHHKDTKAAKEHKEPALCFFVFFVPLWFKPAASEFALQPYIYHSLAAVVWQASQFPSFRIFVNWGVTVPSRQGMP
ncbi:MAG: hypothetical protein NTZ98_22490, partial [Acidobacteria bacterium]|nr:hypothetical protein [Acidobacteriota bacterium]